MGKAGGPASVCFCLGVNSAEQPALAPAAASPSSFEFARTSVAYWLKRGVPKSKLVLGVPFYGHAFGAAAGRRGNGYKDIVARFPGAELRDQAGDTIWYNGIPTIRAKARYVRDEGLAGIMIWSLNNDAPGDKSLLAAIDAELSAPAHAVAAGRR